MERRFRRPGQRRLLRYLSVAIVLAACVIFQSFSFVRLQKFSLRQGSVLSSLRNLTLTDVTSAGRDLYAAATKSAHAKPPGYAIVDADKTAAHVTTVDAISNQFAREAPTNPLGNLTAFSRLRDKYFDVATSYNGSRLAVKEDWNGVRDVAIVANGAPIDPFAAGLKLAAASTKSLKDLTIYGRNGFVYNSPKSAKRSSYRLVRPHELNGSRHANLARVPTLCRAEAVARPRPWLIEFTNVWMSGSGEILVPVGDPAETNEWDVMAFQIQGGVCVENWHYVKHKRVRYDGARRQCMTNTKIAFSVAQNHGASYYHATHEVLPRLLTFWEVAMAVIATPNGKIVGPVNQAVVRNLLRSVGIPDEKLVLIGQHQPCFMEKLFVPAPLLQDYYLRSCLERTVGRLMGENAAARGKQPDTPASKRPLVVLIERAKGRKDGRCQGVRCMANFVELRDAIQREFGGRIELQILSARDPNVMQRGVELFRHATVVVGVHGGGWTNIMFMREGAYAIHLGWKVVFQIYGIQANRYGVDFVNIVTRNASQSGDNVVADIPVVVLQVRRSLLQAGFPLDRPKMWTSPWRNALVSMRMPRNGREDLQTKLARWNPFT